MLFVNNVLREYNEKTKKILKMLWNILYKKQWKRIASVIKKLK